MEFTIHQILLMQDIITDVRRRTQELTISEIVSREIDPVLFIHLLTTEQFPLNGTFGYCHVSHVLNNYLVKFVFGLSFIQHRFRSSSRSLSVQVAEHDRTYGWIRPKQ